MPAAPAASAARLPAPLPTVHDRPVPAIDRYEAGHAGGDLIIATTTVRRSAPTCRIFRRAVRSIARDQGIEMARHLATAAKLGAPVSLRDSRSARNRARMRTPLDGPVPHR